MHNKVLSLWILKGSVSHSTDIWKSKFYIKCINFIWQGVRKSNQISEISSLSRLASIWSIYLFLLHLQIENSLCSFSSCSFLLLAAHLMQLLSLTEVNWKKEKDPAAPLNYFSFKRVSSPFFLYKCFIFKGLKVHLNTSLRKFALYIYLL